MAVAVDHKARRVAEYRRGVEDFRERLGDARRADVPRDVPREFRRRQTEAVKFRRDVIAGVIAEEDKATGPLRAKDSRRRQVNRHPAASVTFTVTSMPRKAPGEPA